MQLHITEIFRKIEKFQQFKRDAYKRCTPFIGAYDKNIFRYGIVQDIKTF